MNTEEIKKLIEKFYNGETNEAEEQILSDYFGTKDIDEDMQTDKEIFSQLQKHDNIDVPPYLEQKLIDMIDSLSLEEAKVKRQPVQKKRLWNWRVNAVAGIALLIFAGIHFISKQDDVIPSYSNLKIEDKKKIEDAEKALLLLSSNFNKGIDKIETVSTTLDKTNEILNKTLSTKD